MMNPMQQQAPQPQPGAGPSAAGPMAGLSNIPMPTDRELVSFSVKSAETFVSAYYAATDSPNRARLLPILYSPTASIVWNGTPVPAAGEADAQQQAAASQNAADGKALSAGGLAALLATMPGSKHEVASFDAHPVGWGIGADGIPSLRSILINVSGLVQHHTPAAALPPSNEPKSAVGSSASIAAESMLALPRAFSQTFMLIDGAGAAGSEQGGVRVVEERGPRAPAGAASTSASGAGPSQLTRTARWFVQSDSFRFVG